MDLPTGPWPDSWGNPPGAAHVDADVERQRRVCDRGKVAGAGFIGANFVDRILARGDAAIVYDDLSRPGVAANVAWLGATHGDGAFTLVTRPVQDAVALAEAMRDVDVVVHLAGQTAVTSSIDDPRADFTSNALGTLNVLATLTYHCDLALPPGWVNRIANRAVDVMNDLAGRLAHRIVAYTADFAEHSPYLRRFARKVEIIPPLVEVAPVTPEAVASFRARHRLDGRGPVIGMAPRLATEKGVEVLLEALPRVLAQQPELRVLFAGQHTDVLGEEAYARRLAPFARPASRSLDLPRRPRRVPAIRASRQTGGQRPPSYVTFTSQRYRAYRLPPAPTGTTLDIGS